MYSTQLRFIWAVTNGGVPDSPNRVRGLNDLFLGALTCKDELVCGCQGSLTFSVVEEHSELFFNEIMPRGPGIVSIRDV